MFYCLLAIIGISFMLQVSALADYVLPGFGVILIAYLAMLTMQQDPVYLKRMALLNVLIVSSVVLLDDVLSNVFVMQSLIDRLVDKNLFGLHLSTTVFYASESIFIILLGPIMAWSWLVLRQQNKNPSTINKFILGILFAGLGMFVLSMSTQFPNAQGLINPAWICWPI